MARDLYIFRETISLAGQAVPAGVGVITTGCSFLPLCVNFWGAPSAGDLRWPKPTLESEKRTTRASLRPKTTRDIDRLFLQSRFSDFDFLLITVSPQVGINVTLFVGVALFPGYGMEPVEGLPLPCP